MYKCQDTNKVTVKTTKLIIKKVEVSGQKASFSWQMLLEKKTHSLSLFYKTVFLSNKDSLKRHFSHNYVLPSLAE